MAKPAARPKERKHNMLTKLIKLLKAIAVIAFFAAALGYVGHMDSEYEADRAMMANSPQLRKEAL